MKDALLKLFVLMTTIFTISTCRAETYFCAAEKSTGFRFRSNWEQGNFTVENLKYIFRSVKKGEKDTLGMPITAPFIVYRSGESDFIDRRFNSCSTNSLGNLVYCDTFGRDFVFNKEQLLFQSVEKFGYVLQHDKNLKSDVTITIGKCSKID